MRWKFVIPFTAVVALIVVFTVFFLDTIIRKAAVAAGEKIFSAKVEIAGVKTKISNLSVSVTGIAVADAKDPWKNIFEARSVHFAMQPVPLLSKKFIIDDMSIEGIRWGTKRKTSGALPPKKIAKLKKKEQKEDKNSFTAKLLGKIKEKGKSEIAELPAVTAVKQAQDDLKNISLDKAVNVADLQSIKEMDSMKASLETKYTQYQDRYKNLNLDARVTDLMNALQEAKSIKVQGPQDLEPAKEKIAKLNQTKESLEKTYNELKTLQSQLSADFGEEKDVLARINALKDKDIQAVSAKLKLPSLSYRNVSQSIFGPLWVSRVDRAVYYIHLARKYMPPHKKDARKIEKQRLRGMDIAFRKDSVPPDFLIRKVSLSGTTGGEGKTGEPMNFSGTVTDITSDQALLGRPTRLELQGAQGAQRLHLTGIFDHTGDVGVDTLKVDYAGLDVSSFGMPSSGYLPDFQKGTAAVASTFTLSEERLNCLMNVNISGLESPTLMKTQEDEVKKVVAELWAGIPGFTINAEMSGTLGNMQMSVTSNLDQLLSSRLQALYGQKVAELQARIQAEINKLTDAKKQELLQEFNAKKTELLSKLAGGQKDAQAKIDFAKQQLTDAQNKEKSKLEDEIKKKASEQLKGLFGR